MKLISINIEDNIRNKIDLEFLKRENADVVCLQEFLEEDFDFYKKELNLGGIYQATCYWTSSVHPELVGKKQGIAIFAKNIIDSGSIFYSGKEENLSKSFDEYQASHDQQYERALAWVDIKNNDGIVYRFITTHLPVTENGDTTDYQLKVTDSLLTKLKNFREFVLCGDMNAPRGKEAFGHIAKKYKDNIPLEYKTSLDQNLHRVKGLQNMVDGLFTTPTYRASNVKLVDGVSDHMAIVATIEKDYGWAYKLKNILSF
jgi:exonuclease III